MSKLPTTRNTALEPLLTKATRRYITEATSEATRKAYQVDVRLFVKWCETHELAALPSKPEIIAEFLAQQADLGVAPNTLNRRVAAIRYAHEAAGLESPTAHKLVCATMAGIRRVKGGKPKQKQAATVDRLEQLLMQINTQTLQGKRDKALLLLGFAGAFRRSELAALDMTDIECLPEGLRITIPKSKTDQMGEGQIIAIYNGRLDVAGILQTYLQAGAIQKGPVFRPMTKKDTLRPQALSDKAVALIIKRYATAAGLNAADYAGHSLRAGFITTAAEAGANLFKIMDVSRHKNVQTVKQYVRQADLFKDHAGTKFL